MDEEQGNRLYREGSTRQGTAAAAQRNLPAGQALRTTRESAQICHLRLTLRPGRSR